MDDEKVDEKIAAVSGWMTSKGWPVDDQKHTSMYYWRCHAVRPVVTLFITENLFDDNSAVGLVRILERLRTAEYLKHAPEKFTIVRERDGDHEPEIRQLVEFPKDIIVRSAS